MPPWVDLDHDRTRREYVWSCRCGKYGTGLTRFAAEGAGAQHGVMCPTGRDKWEADPWD